MFNYLASVRNIAPFVAIAALLLSTAPAQAGDCQSALNNSTGYVSLTTGTSTTQTKGVDEWENEVVKVRTSLPGVLTITGTGPGSQSALFTAASALTHPRIDSARLGTGARDLQVIVRAGDHCIQIKPPTGSSGNFTAEALFTDVCHLGDPDDHGDSFLCATPLTVGGSSVSGEITYSSSTDDGDVFLFTLTAAAAVEIESSGSTDVKATLYDANGASLASDDNSGSSPNFKITQSLAAGQYYVRIEGSGSATGSYGVTVAEAP